MSTFDPASMTNEVHGNLLPSIRKSIADARANKTEEGGTPVVTLQLLPDYAEAVVNYVEDLLQQRNRAMQMVRQAIEALRARE